MCAFVKIDCVSKVKRRVRKFNEELYKHPLPGGA